MGDQKLNVFAMCKVITIVSLALRFSLYILIELLLAILSIQFISKLPASGKED